MKSQISVVIPAHNEERYLPGCLEAVNAAIQFAQADVEIVVVLNRCSDRTAEIATSYGCKLIEEHACNLSKIRNVGISAANAEIVATCDADSRMHKDTLKSVLQLLDGKYWIGGGAVILPERWSIGILASALAVFPYLAASGVSFGLFWFRKVDFEAIGGFDENLVTVEDLDFARRLKKHGKISGRKWGTLIASPVVTSCRKFDQFGDWYFFLNPGFVRRAFKGTDRKVADSFWYEARSKR